jgi:uncharacterized protein YndB with AHSA1/START domain
MEHDEPLTITRETDFDVDAENLWQALSDADALASWLGDEVALDVREGETGTVLDDGVLRHVRIDRVREGEGLSFTWWEAGQPDVSSTVRIDIAALPDGRSRLAIVETFGGSAPRMTARARVDARDRWGLRMLCLWVGTVAAAALVR